MIRNYFAVATFVLALTTVEGGKTLDYKSGKCKGTSDVSFTLGKKNQNVAACVKKCLNDDNCIAMQFEEPKFCSLYYSKVKKIVDAEGYSCGRVTVVDDEDDGYVAQPPPATCEDSSTYVFGTYEYEGVVTNNDCAWITANEAKIGARRKKWCGETVDGSVVSNECPVACGRCEGQGPPAVCEDSSTYVFGTYEYEGVVTNNDCAWITANEAKTGTRRKKWCGKTVDGSLVSDECPIACGRCTPAPPEPPIETAPTTCTLVATLGYPFSDPDDALYYGYNAEWIEVTMQGDYYDYECSWMWSNNLPDWCTYSNSDPEADSAIVLNYEDKYYPCEAELEELTSEKVVLIATAGEVYDFKVSHYFAAEDYYSNYESWNDHMLAAILKIKNTSNEDQGQLKKKGWSRPTDVNIPSHIETAGGWAPNPDFKDKFNVQVTCDDECVCASTYEVL